MARTTRSMGSPDIVPMEASPEKKIATARSIKTATITKAKAANSSAGTETEVVGSSTRRSKVITPAATPVVPAVGTQAWYEYNREQRLIQKTKKRVARKKKLELEETVFAKDVEDSEDERKPKRLKQVEKTKIRNKQTEAAAALARSKELSRYWITKEDDDTCYLFKLPREVRDMIYGYVFNESHSYSPIDMSRNLSEWIRWDLPGIFTACSATYEESSLAWLRRSTVLLSLKDPKFRNMLSQVKVESRGLRANKVTEDCTDFMANLTQFSCIHIRLNGNWGLPKKSQAVWLNDALDFFSKLDYSEGKRIVVDLRNLYAVTAVEAKEVTDCVRGWMDKIPAIHLTMCPINYYMAGSYYSTTTTRSAPQKLHEDLVADYKDRLTETDVRRAY